VAGFASTSIVIVASTLKGVTLLTVMAVPVGALIAMFV
jgi:hypothetical protein